MVRLASEGRLAGFVGVAGLFLSDKADRGALPSVLYFNCAEVSQPGDLTNVFLMCTKQF